jgi:Type II CAAX prenyl endopeptidase Rce1-like
MALAGQLRTWARVGVLALAVWVTTPRPFRGSVFLGLLAVALCVAALGAAMARRLEHAPPLRWERLGLGLGIGTLVGAALLVVLVYLLVPVVPSLATRLAARAQDPAWMPWALATEASVLEELLFRFFLLTLGVWVMTRAWRGRPGAVPTASVWVANAVAALAFAAVHLPAWVAVTDPSATLVGAVLALNAVAGLVLGWVYWRWGIEAAVVAHFAADMVVQGLGPRLLS